ncbi:hypothetical protein [Nonomuraea sp. NPDC052265]|uniref:hypothetical protein n=1 Tax=Nonomuraea sp. NPDC052265 TaxID=3364374 RepID=UPI0037C80E18
MTVGRNSMGTEPAARRRSGGQIDIGEADVLQERVVRIGPASMSCGVSKPGDLRKGMTDWVPAYFLAARTWNLV